MADRGSVVPWPEPPPGPKPSPGTRAWEIVRALHRGGWLRPRRIGCMLIVLVVLLFAALWVLGSTVNAITAVFREDPVEGGPDDTPTPTIPTTSGSRAIDKITNRGWLIVAIQEAPGLAERSPESNDYTGFSVELVELLARDLGVNPASTNYKQIPLPLREGSLRRLEVQLVLGGYEITAQQGVEADAAGPYLEYRPQLAVPANSPVTSLDSLGDGKVCAPRDSPVATELAGKLGERLTTQASLGDCADLLGGEAQAVAGDETALRRLPTMGSGELRMIGAPLGTITYGIGVPPGDPVFRDRINEVLRKAVADGTWKDLYEQCFGTPVPDPPAVISGPGSGGTGGSVGRSEDPRPAPSSGSAHCR